jgi:flagellar hook-associated protein 2
MISSIAKSLGYGSGIDTPALVNDLANASRAPKVQRLDNLSQSVLKKIGALAQARSDLESFATSLAGVSSQSTMRTQPTVSDTAILTAMALPGARLGGLASELTVSQLARSQVTYSGYASSATAAIGQGGMTLAVNGQIYAITIDPTNDTLNGLVSAINASASGVKASLISDPRGFRLVLKGETGEAKGFTLTTDAGASAGLEIFTTAAMAMGQQARDAQITIDGIAYTRPTNIIDDLLPGVSLTLKSAAPTASVSIGVQRPTDALRGALNDFISVFNTVKNDVAQARTSANGAEAIRSLDRQLSFLVSQAVTSHATINSLSDVGVRSNRDGSISLDTTKFEAALAADPEALEAIFSPTRDLTHTLNSDPGITGALLNIKDATVAGNGPFDLLKKRFDAEANAIAKDREKLEAREAAYRARLEAQFGAMDGKIGSIKATQSYLEQQIKIWNSGK